MIKPGCMILALCVAGGGYTAEAPDVTPFYNEVRHQVSTAHPTWKETQSEVEPRRGRIVWQAGQSPEDWINLRVYLHPTVEEAKGAFATHTRFINVPPVKHNLAIGDELRLYRANAERGSGSVHFRRGRLIVSVAASSVVEAERLAKRIDELALRMSP